MFCISDQRALLLHQTRIFRFTNFISMHIRNNQLLVLTSAQLIFSSRSKYKGNLARFIPITIVLSLILASMHKELKTESFCSSSTCEASCCKVYTLKSEWSRPDFLTNGKAIDSISDVEVYTECRSILRSSIYMGYTPPSEEGNIYSKTALSVSFGKNLNSGK
jgi:hypothetical protein